MQPTPSDIFPSSVSSLTSKIKSLRETNFENQTNKKTQQLHKT